MHIRGTFDKGGHFGVPLNSLWLFFTLGGHFINETDTVLYSASHWLSQYARILT